MKNNTRIAVAGLLSAAGSALQAIGQELLEGIPATAENSGWQDQNGPCPAPDSDPAPAPTKRGRKPAAEKTVTPTPEPEPQPEPTPTPAEESKEEGESAEAKEARYQRNRSLIEPLVKGVKKEGSETEYAIRPQGPAVKAIIQKLSPTKLLPDLPLDKQAEFETDLESLTM